MSGKIDGWQDIETARQAGWLDGRELLGCNIEAGTETMLVRWIAPVDFLTDAEIAEWSRRGMTDADLETEDWFIADFLQGYRISPDCYPTLLALVPAPPGAAHD